MCVCVFQVSRFSERWQETISLQSKGTVKVVGVRLTWDRVCVLQVCVVDVVGKASGETDLREAATKGMWDTEPTLLLLWIFLIVRLHTHRNNGDNGNYVTGEGIRTGRRRRGPVWRRWPAMTPSRWGTRSLPLALRQRRRLQRSATLLARACVKLGGRGSWLWYGEQTASIEDSSCITSFLGPLPGDMLGWRAVGCLCHATR